MGNILRILFSAGDNGNEYARLEDNRRETENRNHYYKFDSNPVSSSSNTGPDQGEFGGFRSNNPPTTESPTPSDIKDAKEAGKGGTERYDIPKHIEGLVKNDIVPPVLKRPLSPDTYADYFVALLYAEDFYCEKWSDYLLKDIALNLREKENPGLQNHQYDRRKSKRHSNLKSAQKSYPYVVFKIEDVPKDDCSSSREIMFT